MIQHRFYHRIAIIPFILLVISFASCEMKKAPEYTSVADITGHSETRVLRHADWSRNATIYSVNIRQHTPEGTLNALRKDLSRLKTMGVDILWLSPIHPIGEKNRRGLMGNPHSVKDYYAVNPQLGNTDEFRAFVRDAHSKGLKVILDWSANQTAWDHPWTIEHPDWYHRDTSGTVLPPSQDWPDAAALNYENDSLRMAMLDAMRYWVKEMDVDGYHCHSAGSVPTEFWATVRSELDNIKPVFMLSDAEQKELHLKAFDMSYAREFLQLMNGIARREKTLSDIDHYLAVQDSAFPRSAYRMYFTSLPHEDALYGTEAERFGSARQVYDVLAYTIAGMPMVCSGQEGGESYPDGAPHRLKRFEKDTIHWNGYPYQDFYSRLLNAHRDNPALWNGEFGGNVKRLPTSQSNHIYAFSRIKDNNEVVVLLNFSNRSHKIDFTSEIPKGNYLSIFNTQSLALFTRGEVPLPAFGYQVFVKK